MDTKGQKYLGLILICVVCNFVMVTAQELEHFDKDTTIDFEKLGVLAEILPSSTTRPSRPRSTIALTTKTTGSHVVKTTRSDASKTTGSDSSKTDVVKITEGDGRLGRVVGTELTSETIKGSNETETTMMMIEEKETSTEVIVPAGIGQQDDFAKGTPPHITWPRPNLERILVKPEEENYYMVNCQASGIPAPKFQWFRNDAVVDSSGTLIKAFDNGTLLVPKFSDRENGLYQCHATNRYGTSVSNKIPILKDDPPRRTQNETVTSVMGIEGEATFLSCGNTPPTVSRYIKRWYSTSALTEVRIDERVGTDLKGTLRFAYLLERDEDENYKCALAPESAPSQASIHMFNTVKLDVRSRTKPLPQFGPKLEFSSKKVKALIGRSATLECFFSGNPVPKITWRNSQNQEVQDRDPRLVKTDEGRKLIIRDVLQEDEGNFVCIADSVMGRLPEILTVNVTTPPLMPLNDQTDKVLTTLTTPDRRGVTLKCKARAAVGELLDAPRWYRNGMPLNEVNLPDPSRYRFSSDNTELHIKSLKKDEDTACFQCNTTNSEGYLFYDGYLRVIESIEIVTYPPEVNEISRGDVIDISVVAKGDACCPLRTDWEFNGAPLNAEVLQKPPFVWEDRGDRLIFDSSSVSNETLKSFMGQYRCRVSNTWDEAVVSFNITLKADVTTAGPQIASDEDGFKLWWIGLICGLLAIIIAIIIIIFFIKSNYPRDTYQLEKTELKHHLNPEEDLLNQSFQEI